MDYLLKHHKVIMRFVCVLAIGLIIGRFSMGGDDSKLLLEQFEKERDGYRKDVIRQERIIIEANQRIAQREKFWQDSVKSLNVTIARHKAYTRQILKDNEKINYTTYSNPELDSIDAILFGSR